MSVSTHAAAEPRARRRVRLLLPHEHGAWFMLLSPAAIGFAAAPEPRVPASVLLLLTLVSLFLARNAADTALRPRQRSMALPWLAVYGTLGALTGVALLGVTHALPLLGLGGAAGALYGLHLALRRTRARLDRTAAGEWLGVAGLCLGAPAAIAVGGGRLDAHAWALWALCWLFFGSSVAHVRGLLEAAKVRGAFGRPERRRVAWPVVAYHAAAALPLAAIAGVVAPSSPGTVWLAVAPAYVRALAMLLRRTNRLPRLALVGVGEIACTLWFTVVVALAMR